MTEQTKGEGMSELATRIEAATAAPLSDRVSPYTQAGRYDSAARRRGKRQGRERGCWLYVPLAELEKTGHAVEGPPPYYRVWGSTRGRLVVQLYKAG